MRVEHSVRRAVVGLLDLREDRLRLHRGPILRLTQLSDYLTLKGSFSAVSKPTFASKHALESSRRDLQNTLLCTVLETNPQKPGKTWKEKGLAKTTSGRDDQKKPVAAASYSILQRDEWLRRKNHEEKSSRATPWYSVAVVQFL